MMGQQGGNRDRLSCSFNRESHVPVWGKTQRNDDTLSSSEFEWDEQADEYCCPQGQSLRSEWRAFERTRTRITQRNIVIHRASGLLAASA